MRQKSVSITFLVWPQSRLTKKKNKKTFWILFKIHTPTGKKTWIAVSFPTKTPSFSWVSATHTSFITDFERCFKLFWSHRYSSIERFLIFLLFVSSWNEIIIAFISNPSVMVKYCMAVPSLFKVLGLGLGIGKYFDCYWITKRGSKPVLILSTIAEMMMLLWMYCKTRRYMIRIDNISESWGNTCSRKDGGN